MVGGVELGRGRADVADGSDSGGRGSVVGTEDRVWLWALVVAGIGVTWTPSTLVGVSELVGEAEASSVGAFVALPAPPTAFGPATTEACVVDAEIAGAARLVVVPVETLVVPLLKTAVDEGAPPLTAAEVGVGSESFPTGSCLFSPT